MDVPSWSALILSSSWTEQQEEQEERWASGDTLVVLRVVLGGLEPPSLLLSCTVERGREGHHNRGQSHQTPLEVRVGGRDGGVEGGWRDGEMEG